MRVVNTGNVSYDTEDAASREAFVKAVTNGSAVSWRHINFLGEYDFSEEKLQDTVGIKSPKLTDYMRLIFGTHKKPRIPAWRISYANCYVAFGTFVGI